MAVPAAGAAGFPSAAFTKWNEVSGAAFVGPDLVALVTATEPVYAPRPDGSRGALAFRYHSAVAIRTRLRGGRTRFVRPDFTTAVSVRTSAGTMSGSRIAAAAGRFVVVPGGRGFAPPVVWCCTPEGTEVVVESDGRPGAPVPVAAGIDGTRVRALTRSAATAGLLSASPQLLADPDAADGTRTTAVFGGAPARGTSAVTTGLVAWTDAPDAGVLSTGVPSDGGVSDIRTVTLGGRILAVWADPGLVVALVRSGRRYAVLRVLPGGAWRTAWSGSRVPRVAVGRGTVAVADGRAVFASRRGAVRRIATARGPVAAVAADATRIAWFERITRRRGEARTRWTAARLARVVR